MAVRLWLLSVTIVVWSISGIAHAQSPPPSRMLFVTRSAGFEHQAIKRNPAGDLSTAEVAMIQLGEQSGLFKATCTKEVETEFTKENLQNYDIVAFYTTGDLPIAKEHIEYFLNDWLKQKGHGVLGIHSAMDTYHDYEPYWDMIGGVFTHHPWTQNTRVTIANHDPENPLTKPFGPELAMQEEIYMYRNFQPEKVRVLMSLSYAKSANNVRVNTQWGYHVPVVWIKNYGEGKVYCNNLGHRPDTWVRKDFLESLTTAVKWIRGEVDIDATPNPELSKQQEELAKKEFQEKGYQGR